MRLRWALPAIVAAASVAGPAQAERLVMSLSNQQVAISSNFTGAAVVLFGIVERDAQSAARSGAYDVVVTVRGPREAVTVRRKEPFGPIWLNREQQKFVEVPSLLGVYTTRPLASLMETEFRRRNRIGLHAALSAPEITPIGRAGSDDPFMAALIRLKRQANLYVENDNGVVFITDTAFRARVPLPANAPLGDYVIEAALLAGGAVLTRHEAAFSVMKAGVEERLSETARDHAFLYGLGTAAMAVMFGWLASVIFRRD